MIKKISGGPVDSLSQHDPKQSTTPISDEPEGNASPSFNLLDPSAPKPAPASPPPAAPAHEMTMPASVAPIGNPVKVEHPDEEKVEYVPSSRISDAEMADAVARAAQMAPAAAHEPDPIVLQDHTRPTAPVAHMQTVDTTG